MARFLKSLGKSGHASGSLVLVGEPETETVQVSLMTYDEAGVETGGRPELDQWLASKDSGKIFWVDLAGLRDLSLLADIGRRLGIHSLTLEDIGNTGQRPKLEEFENYIYLAFRHLIYDADRMAVSTEQVSLVLGEGTVVSFLEREFPCFEPVRERIRRGKGRIRKSGAGYLAYALLDSVVDHYYTVLGVVGDDIAALEQEMLEHPGPDHLERTHTLKREMIYMRKQVWPMREILAKLRASDSDLFDESLRVYFSDVHDHAIHVMDTIESFRELLSGMLDLYLSSVSYRMNEVMRILTIIATIFIPLTFLAGIYGMNFKFTPELDIKWAYFLLLGIMGAMAGGMVAYFRHKKWL